jgi:hypothetical protein
MCAAKLLCFQAVSGFESHRLHHLKKNLPQKTANCSQLCCFFLHSNMNLSGFAGKTAHGALHAHRAHQRRQRKISLRQRAVHEDSPADPIPGATYYLRRSGGARTPILIGKDLAAAHAALLHMEDREIPNEVRARSLLASQRFAAELQCLQASQSRCIRDDGCGPDF